MRFFAKTNLPTLAGHKNAQPVSATWQPPGFALLAQPKPCSADVSRGAQHLNLGVCCASATALRMGNKTSDLSIGSGSPALALGGHDGALTPMSALGGAADFRRDPAHVCK